jgi:hypothetical protein
MPTRRQALLQAEEPASQWEAVRPSRRSRSSSFSASTPPPFPPPPRPRDPDPYAPFMLGGLEFKHHVQFIVHDVLEEQQQQRDATIARIIRYLVVVVLVAALLFLLSRTASVTSSY